MHDPYFTAHVRRTEATTGDLTVGGLDLDPD
jgi:hypothetical protein